MEITEFHHLEIGQRFMLEKNPISKILKNFRGPFMKTGHFSFSRLNERGNSTGPSFSAMWHDPIRPLTIDEAIKENNKNVLTTILVESL
ncbi:MAG: hypothetical protein GX577_05625 [Leptolinea sp.]|nr:hypothetical protein [Leptolinea sp.]